MKIFTKDVEINGKPGIKVYTDKYKRGIWVLWEEIESGMMSLAEAKQRVEEISLGEIYD